MDVSNKKEARREELTDTVCTVSTHPGSVCVCVCVVLPSITYKTRNTFSMRPSPPPPKETLTCPILVSSLLPMVPCSCVSVGNLAAVLSRPLEKNTPLARFTNNADSPLPTLKTSDFGKHCLSGGPDPHDPPSFPPVGKLLFRCMKAGR